MILLLDLGNTRLKFALLDGETFTHRGAFGWDADIAHELATLWATWPAPLRVVGASVVDSARETAVFVRSTALSRCSKMTGLSAASSTVIGGSPWLFSQPGSASSSSVMSAPMNGRASPTTTTWLTRA